MPYDTSVPATGHVPAQDYQAMQQNYAQIQTSFSVNHVPLATGGATEGYHSKVNLAGPLTDPTLSATYGQIYEKSQTVGSDTYYPLFYAMKPQTAAQIVRQLTDLSITTNSNSPNGGDTQYSVVTPWGLRFTFGNVQVNGGGSQAVGFVQNFGGTPYVALTSARLTGALGTGSTVPNTTTFTVYLASGAGNQVVNYLVIGPA